MIEIKNKSNCCGCTACKNICPKNAIVMLEDEKGFKYPQIDKQKCINCGLCEMVCPILKKSVPIEKMIAYAAINKDETIRMNSSSGGIFTLLAENIIQKGGAVFGVELDENFHAKHTYIEKIEDIEKFRGSKYMQSELGDSYLKVKEFLEKDRYVLFTGTPCQVGGLKSFLKKEYKKLYTQDIICHGVPSSKTWDKYLEYRRNVDKLKDLKSIKFRNKNNYGWNSYELSFKYEENEVFIDHNKDLFMKAFLSDIALRDSCYECKFKNKNRKSDILVADFWGIEQVLPEMNDEKGISLVIINSQKGKKIFEEIKKSVEYKKVDTNLATKNNPSMIKSANYHKNTQEFFLNIENLEFDELIKRYVLEKEYIKL